MTITISEKRREHGIGLLHGYLKEVRRPPSSVGNRKREELF